MGIGKVLRRTFLIGSAAVAGGVAFGVYHASRTPENPLDADLGDGEASFNPWVKITGDGITLIAPHSDVGQGVAHLQTLLIAEEMDLELDQFHTAFGAPAQAYFNGAVVEEGLPFLAADAGRMAELARGAASGVAKLLSLQVTGGSSTVPDSYYKLRTAGAVARETLKAAASEEYGVDVSALATAAGAVQLPDGRTVSYTALAARAARVPPVEDVALRDPGTWRLIGKDTLRRDVTAKSTGQQAYGIDLELDGMLHAAVRLSPRRSDALQADLSAAEAMPGVIAVLPVTGGFAAVAETTWTAFQAAEAITVEWGPAPYPAEQDAHWAALADALDEGAATRTWRDDGDVEARLGDAAVVAEYRAPYVAHQPLEPLNATAQLSDAGLDIWTATQMPGFAQRVGAEAAGIATDRVTLHNQFGGGSFGHRLEMEHIRQAVEVAVALKDRPVKLTYRREEDFAQDFPRQITLGRGRGAVQNGQVAALALDIAAPAPSTSQLGRLGIPGGLPDIQLAAGVWNAPYALPHCRVRSFEIDGLAPVSSWRSVGASANGFVLEGMLDEVIHAAGADPMEERLRLCNWDVARGTLEAVAEMSDWGAPLPAGRGRGVALVVSFGVPTAEVVEVTATDSGIRIDQVWVAADVGRVIDPVNFENQVQGGVIWGLGHAINCEVTYADGAATQANYYDAETMRLYQAPRIAVRGLERNTRIRGIGEPPVPPAAPALANAIFAATGERLREMPFWNHIDFI